MRNILIKIAYDGSKFHGWQVQNNAHTVQAEFQEALYKIIREEVDIKACSRTDSGVHAREFCISVLTNSKIECSRLNNALNHFFPKTMAALSCEEVAEDFHARYSCKAKEYVYQIYNSKTPDPFLNERALYYWHDIDDKKLNEAASHYVGTHNFKAFCTKDARIDGDLTRTVYSAKIHREGKMVYFTVKADGFLYNMVRIMVGTLIRVQEGKIQPEKVEQIILSKDRQNAGPTAPAHGLYLNKVFYD